MKKVHVNIDNGPNNYREAVQLFKDLNALLGATLKEQITLTGMPMNRKNGTETTAPNALVDGHLIVNATVADIKAAIKMALTPRPIAA